MRTLSKNPRANGQMTRSESAVSYTHLDVYKRQVPEETMKQPQGFGRIAEREQGLKRRLTSGQMSMIAIGGAIGTGLFLGSKFAIGFAGPSVIISYAIGGLITLDVYKRQGRRTRGRRPACRPAGSPACRARGRR